MSSLLKRARRRFPSLNHVRFRVVFDREKGETEYEYGTRGGRVVVSKITVHTPPNFTLKELEGIFITEISRYLEKEEWVVREELR